MNVFPLVLRYGHCQHGMPPNAHEENHAQESVSKGIGQEAEWPVDTNVVEGANRKSRAIGLVKNMTKSEARTVVGQIVAELVAKRQQDRRWPFGEFVTEIYFPYYIRK